jgi:tetratricopeptide (TPR) repeat protein
VKAPPPPPLAVRNPWAPGARLFAAGAPIALVPLFLPRNNLNIDSDWQQATDMIQAGDYDGAQQIIAAQMSSNPSLDGMFTVVSELQQANVSTPEFDKVREKTLDMAREEMKSGSNRPLPYVAAAKLSLEDGDDATFEQATDEIEKKFPESEYAPYFNGLRKLKEHDWKAAEDAFRTAQQRGIPTDSVAAFLKAAIDNQKWVWEYAAITGYVIAGWLVGLGLLFLVGKTLSRLTLSSIDRRGPEVASFTDRLLRAAYRGIVGLAGIYYYLSLPVVLLLAIAVPLSLGYACLMLPYVNLGLIAIVLVVGLGGVLTALSGIRTAFVRVQAFKVGQIVTPEAAPRLWKVARDAAARVGTRPIDEIRVIPSADIAVVELGGMIRRACNRGKRVLILGVGALQGLKLDAFRCILAHEYGHFQNRDTAGGNVSLRVNIAMRNFAEAIQKRGKIHWYDLAVHFLRLYHFLFRRLTFGASRLQEVMADRVAVIAYGREALREGLTHAIRRAVEFDLAVSRAVRDTIRQTRPAVAFYQLAATLELDERDHAEKVLRDILERQTNEEDSHPSPRDRFALARKVEAANPPLSAALAWELVADCDPVVGAMNRLMHDMVDYESKQRQATDDIIIQFITNLLRMNPDPNHYLERARLYTRLGKYDKALADINQALDRVPKEPILLFRRGLVQKLLENYQEAIDDLNESEQLLGGRPLEPEDQLAFNVTLGQCYAKFGKHEDAIEAFSKAIKAQPESLLALIERGRSYAAIEEWEKALADFSAAIESWPRSVEAYVDRARVRQALSDKVGAEEDEAVAQWLAPHALAAMEVEAAAKTKRDTARSRDTVGSGRRW